MKIISKYKDYYDYLQGIYGQDEKVILDRTKGTSLEGFMEGLKNEDGDEETLLIMGTVFKLICYNKKWYTSKQLYDMGKAVYGGRYNSKPYIGDLVINTKTGKPYPFDKKILTTTKNEELNCPILLDRSTIFYNHKCIEYPKLSTFNFGSIISPEDMYINLYNWLSREKEAPTEQTDKQKIVSHGFDLKTSFRNM